MFLINNMIIDKQKIICQNGTKNTPKYSPEEEGKTQKIIFSVVTLIVMPRTSSQIFM